MRGIAQGSRAFSTASVPQHMICQDQPGDNIVVPVALQPMASARIKALTRCLILLSIRVKDSHGSKGFSMRCCSFWVVNHRQPLKFLYLQYPSISTGVGPDFAWGKQKVLASATLGLSPQLMKAPHQLRLSLRPRGWK